MDYQKFKESAKKRRERIAALREKGWTVQRIAEKEAVTPQRISKILKQVEKERAAQQNPTEK